MAPPASHDLSKGGKEKLQMRAKGGSWAERARHACGLYWRQQLLSGFRFSFEIKEEKSRSLNIS
eukprot:1153064-Pelagomonas_calceolata.AAC.8